MPNNNRYSVLKDYATDQPETIQEENLIEHQTDNPVVTRQMEDNLSPCKNWNSSSDEDVSDVQTQEIVIDIHSDTNQLVQKTQSNSKNKFRRNHLVVQKREEDEVIKLENQVDTEHSVMFLNLT